MNLNEKTKAGFRYLVEVLDPAGRVVDSEVIDNLMPIEGVNHMLGVLLKGGSQYTSWAIGLFEGSYTPTIADTMATFPGDATECTAYESATRMGFTAGDVAGGTASNSAAAAEFVFTADKTVRGGFIASSGVKGGTTGVLLSAVRFASPKVISSGGTLRVTAGLSIVSNT